ncbi:MAG: PA2778 family cysteine peptidase [Betaproteobacteria bacterium]|nr:PA2778 family cysteine peptidase [Betaproteobacteria bacterium]
MFLRKPLLICSALILLVLAGCAPVDSVTPKTPQDTSQKTDNLYNDIPPIAKPNNLPNAFSIKGIPYYPDTRSFFAPSTLASILNFYGANVTAKSLLTRPYIPAQKGTLEFDTTLSARKLGFVVYPLTEDIADLFLEISQQNPVIVTLKNPENPDDWAFHIAYGYDFADRTITVTDMNSSIKKLPMAVFEKEWAQSQYWAVTITPPSVIPASAREIGYLTSISRIEPLAPQAAKEAYLKTLERWPNNVVALIGIGDIAYVHHRYDEALDYFQRAVKTSPNSGDALNNLAQTYLALHQGQKALSTIQKALKLKSHHHKTYLQTQRQIESYLKKHH